MQRGGAPGLSTSVAPKSGTSVQPSSRAARAGKADRRSGVEVKKALAMSSVAMLLALAIAASSSRVPARIASGVSSSMNVAPRTPRHRTGLASVLMDILPALWRPVIRSCAHTAVTVARPSGNPQVVARLFVTLLQVKRNDKSLVQPQRQRRERLAESQNVR